MKRKTILWTLAFFMMAAIWFLPAPVWSDVVTGHVIGGFTGTAGEESLGEGSVSGTWSWDTSTGLIKVDAAFGALGLSGEMSGTYDAETQQIKGVWTGPGSDAENDFSLDLTQTSPLLFAGRLTGSAPGEQGPVPFEIQLELQPVLDGTGYVEISGVMDGEWTGGVSGSWHVEVSTPLGTQTFSDSFSDIAASGQWEGQWRAVMDTAIAEIYGEFSGDFTGTAEVGSVSTPLGSVNLGDIPVQGVHMGTVGLTDGQIHFLGAWQEVLETSGTEGTVHDGFGGPFSLVLGPLDNGFPVTVSGQATGGGSFPGEYMGMPVTVDYRFEGDYSGYVRLP